MGKGDKRTAKGKRCRGTFGKSRPKNKKRKSTAVRSAKPVPPTQATS